MIETSRHVATESRVAPATRAGGGTARAIRTHAVLIAACISLLFALSPSPAVAQCATAECLGGDDRTGPEVSVTPSGGEYSVARNTTYSLSLKIAASDAGGLEQTTLKVRLRQGNVTSEVTGFTWTPDSSGTFALAQGTVQLRSAGENVLTAEVKDKYGNLGSASAVYVLRVEDPNAGPVISVAPHHDAYRDTTLGAATLTYSLPAYFSLDASRSTGLTYNSQHANPTGFVQLDVDTGTIPDGSAAKVVTLQIYAPATDETDGPGTAVTGEDAWAKEPQGKQRVGAQWSMRDKATGAYLYRTGAVPGPRAERDQQPLRFRLDPRRYTAHLPDQ
jgi:hypothetical protein